MRRLLLLEARQLGVASASVDVAMKIDIPDGGEDGHLAWTGGPDPAASNWIPGRETAFQVKATEMGPAACGEEVKAKGGASLKPKIAQTVAAGGSYVLFYGRCCTTTMIDERVAKIREAFTVCGSPQLAKAVEIRVYGAEKIAAWTSAYPSTVVFVLRCLGRAPPGDWQTWDAWSDEGERLLRYEPGTQRLAIAIDLRNHLATPRAVARLVGLSGVGKSRFALELFPPPSGLADDLSQAARSASIAYCPDGAAHESVLPSALRAWITAGAEGIVVVDECPLELHKKLTSIVRGKSSRLSLLSLDYEPDSRPGDSATRFVQLEPVANDVIAAMLKGSNLGLPPEHLDRIAVLAEGFPLMAEMLVGAAREGGVELWKVGDADVVRRLLARRDTPSNDASLEVLQALAIFEHLGVEESVREQLECFVRVVLGVSDTDRVYRTIRSFEEIRIDSRSRSHTRSRSMRGQGLGWTTRTLQRRPAAHSRWANSRHGVPASRGPQRSRRGSAPPCARQSKASHSHDGRPPRSCSWTATVTTRGCSAHFRSASTAAGGRDPPFRDSRAGSRRFRNCTSIRAPMSSSGHAARSSASSARSSASASGTRSARSASTVRSRARSAGDCARVPAAA